MNNHLSKEPFVENDELSAPPSTATLRMMESIHSSGRKQTFKLFAFLTTAGLVGIGTFLYAAFLPRPFLYASLFLTIGGVYWVFRLLGLSPFEGN